MMRQVKVFLLPPIDKLKPFCIPLTEQFAVMWVLFTVIVLGNSAVLVTLMLNRSRKSRMNFFIKQLAIAGKMQCWIDLVEAWRWQLYMCWVSGSLFVVPALIISACYAIIVRTIWAKGTILGPIDRTHNGMADLASRRASSRGIIPRAKVKTVKMTIVIVIVFVVCWSPYIIFDLLQVFGKIPPTQTNVAIATFIQSLAPLNSAANPLIYCLFSTQVCRMIKRLPPFRWLWSTKWCCRPHDSGALPLGNGTAANGTAHGRFHNHNSSDSMRTLTTSLTVSRRSCLRPARVVIVERPKTELAMSEV
uniref:G-protein coupled receptors family 1 profile domain-containing protein n=1 Tax=Anopheles atroparvus TaxID=41427 RepID=A0A182IQ40_ANOAO